MACSGFPPPKSERFQVVQKLGTYKGWPMTLPVLLLPVYVCVHAHNSNTHTCYIYTHIHIWQANQTDLACLSRVTEDSRLKQTKQSLPVIVLTGYQLSSTGRKGVYTYIHIHIYTTHTHTHMPYMWNTHIYVYRGAWQATYEVHGVAKESDMT